MKGVLSFALFLLIGPAHVDSTCANVTPDTLLAPVASIAAVLHDTAKPEVFQKTFSRLTCLPLPSTTTV